VSGQQHAPATLYPRERPVTLFTGGWVGSRAGLDRYGKFLGVGADIKTKRLEWVGHLVRMDHGRAVKKMFESKPEGHYHILHMPMQ